jgi:hypothetical protein
MANRQLTATELETLEKRRLGFDPFVQEIAPVLCEFAHLLRLPNPETITKDPDAFLEAIDDFMRNQVISDENRVWAMARIAYFIGQLSIQRLGGEWMLNEHPNSRFFLQYVIGRMPGVRNPNAMIAPFVIASEYLAQPPARNLTRIISEAEKELQAYWDALGDS